ILLSANVKCRRKSAIVSPTIVARSISIRHNPDLLRGELRDGGANAQGNHFDGAPCTPERPGCRPEWQGNYFGYGYKRRHSASSDRSSPAARKRCAEREEPDERPAQQGGRAARQKDQEHLSRMLIVALQCALNA